MIQSWVKLLPYWLVMYVVRKFNPDGIGKLIIDKEYDIYYFRTGAGEYVVFSKEIQEAYNKRQKLKLKEKTNKKLDKVNKQLRDDYYLKNELRNQFELEKELGEDY